MVPVRERGLDRECSYTAVRSSGPGGQNVNKVATKIELAWNINESELISYEERSAILIQLASKINEDGYLKISSSESRSQATNKEAALEKFYKAVEKALVKPKKRKATKVPKAVKERIKAEKRETAEKKANRKVSREDWS